MKAVICRNLIKNFSAGDDIINVIRGTDLEVAKGEFFMLVGPSGCGKTTLISIVAGILHYDSGICEVMGKNYANMGNTEILDFRAKNIGFIFQSFHLIPTLTVTENVGIPLIINNMGWDDAMKKAREILAEVGLADKIDSFPNQLSGGQQQRVAIARALVHEPALLVCDEPTSSLDHHTGMKIMDTMKAMQKKLGTTLIVVSHDERIFNYADRIAHMDDGVIVKIETNNMEKSYEDTRTQG
ncbi:MAG: ABC transporter ATP-binding protein [Rickettsiales bacterium]